MKIELKEKLDRAKEEFSTIADKAVIEEWESRIREGDKWIKFQRHEVTAEIVAQMRRKILDMRKKLALSRDKEFLSEVISYWAKIDECAYWLKVISKDYEAEMDSLDRELAKELGE